jgi:hypothetical protein
MEESRSPFLEPTPILLVNSLYFRLDEEMVTQKFDIASQLLSMLDFLAVVVEIEGRMELG